MGIVTPPAAASSSSNPLDEIVLSGSNVSFAANDIVTVNSGGVIAKGTGDVGVDNTQLTSNVKVHTALAAQGTVSTYFYPMSATSYYPSRQNTCALLSNGGMAVVGSNALDDDFAILKIDPDGSVANNFIELGTDRGYCPQVISTTNNKLVIAYSNSTGTAQYAQVLDEDFNVEIAEFALTVSSSDQYWAIAPGRTGGTWVHHYRYSTDNNNHYADFYGDDSSTANASNIELFPSSADGAGERCLALGMSNGDFAFWYQYDSGNNSYLSRFTGAGVVVGSSIELYNGANTLAAINNSQVVASSPHGNGYFCELSSGAIVAAHRGTSHMAFSIVNAGNTAITTTLDDPYSAGFTHTHGAIIVPHSTKDSFVVRRISGQAYMAVNESGTVTATTAGGSAPGTTGTMMAGRHVEGAGYVFAYMGNTTTTTHSRFLVHNDAGDFLREVSIANSLVPVNVDYCNAVQVAPDGRVIIGRVDGSQQFASGASSAFARSVIGVATASAAAGANVTVSTHGDYVVNQTVANPAPFDNRALSPIGCKGSAVGNVLLLQQLT